MNEYILSAKEKDPKTQYKRILSQISENKKLMLKWVKDDVKLRALALETMHARIRLVSLHQNIFGAPYGR